MVPLNENKDLVEIDEFFVFPVFYGFGMLSSLFAFVRGNPWKCCQQINEK